MKKISLLILITISCSLFAQNQKTTTIELFGGISQTDLVGKGFIHEYYEKTLGYEIGAKVSRDIKQKINISSGLSLSKFGAKDEIEFTDDLGNHLGFYNDKYNLNYLQIPFLLNIYLTKKKWVIISSGGYIAHLVSQKRKQEYTHNSQTIKSNTNFNKFDIGVKASVGSSFLITKKVSISTELYFKKGFINLLNDSNTNDEIRNLSYGLNFGLAYSLN